MISCCLTVSCRRTVNCKGCRSWMMLVFVCCRSGNWQQVFPSDKSSLKTDVRPLTVSGVRHSQLWDFRATSRATARLWYGTTFSGGNTGPFRCGFTSMDFGREAEPARNRHTCLPNVSDGLIRILLLSPPLSSPIIYSKERKRTTTPKRAISYLSSLWRHKHRKLMAHFLAWMRLSFDRADSPIVWQALWVNSKTGRPFGAATVVSSRSPMNNMKRTPCQKTWLSRLWVRLSNPMDLL